MYTISIIWCVVVFRAQSAQFAKGSPPAPEAADERSELGERAEIAVRHVILEQGLFYSVRN